MIFYKNLKKHKKTKEKNLEFSIFADGIEAEGGDLVAKPNQCKEFYNLTTEGGVLRTGLGFSTFEVPGSFEDYKTLHPVDLTAKIDEVCGIWLDRWFNPTADMFIYQILMTDSQHNIWGVSLVDEYNMVWLKTDKMTEPTTFQCAYRLDNEDTALFFSNCGMIRLSQHAEAIYEEIPALDRKSVV